MSTMSTYPSNVICNAPTEVLIQIFKLLSLTSLTTCRIVCRRWHQILDNPETCDILWRKYCEKSYSDICYLAYRNIKPSLTWYHLYESLTLWAKLEHTKETIYEFSQTNDICNKNVSFQVIRDGIVGVLKDKGVIYYNIETQEELHTLTINEEDQYLKYSENDDLILLLNYRQQLIVRRKENINKIAGVIYNVRLFITLKNVIYYVTQSHSLLYKSTLVNDKFNCVCLSRIPDLVVSLGHKNRIIYLLSYDFTVYSLSDNKLKTVCILYDSIREFQGLRTYNFANCIDWTNNDNRNLFFDSNKMEFPQVANLLGIYTYGPILFACYETSILRIFYSLYMTNVIELLNSEPVKVLQLSEPQKNILNNEVINIDVVEDDKSHIVLVGNQNKMLAIKLSHSCTVKSSSSIEELSTISEVRSIDIGEPKITSRASLSSRKKVHSGVLKSGNEDCTNNLSQLLETGEQFNTKEQSIDIKEPSSKIARLSN